MRFNFVRSALAASAFLVAANAAHAEKVVVGATQVPHAEILEVVKPQLAKQGVELDIKVFSDYVQPTVRNLKEVQTKGGELHITGQCT